MGSSALRLLSALFLLAILAPTSASAGTFNCATSDSTLGAAESALFYPHRPGVKNFDFTWRDTEFMWDALYSGGLTDSVKLTLDSFAHSLVEVTGRNPFGAPYGDMRLIYEYFRREDPTYNVIDPADMVAMRIGINAADHTPRDRSHVDCYVFHNTRDVDYDGSYTSGFMTDDEDLTSDRPIGDVKHANSIALRGPPEGQTIDVAGTGWTAPDKIRNLGFMHEFQHSLPPQQGTPFSTEMLSGASEAIGGSNDTTLQVVDEVPYTWSLLAVDGLGPCGSPSGTCVRTIGSNYQGRSLFAAYLAYNFRGADITATLTGMADDLVWAWAKGPEREADDLRNLLRDQTCSTCAGKHYFRPGGVALDTIDRMALLHHNWRVANYVNNSSLDEGQYGYPPQFGFAPSRQTKAWQAVDPFETDDLVAIPPEVTLNASHRTREMVLKGERSFHGNSYPLVLQPYGSEYWVVRSDPAIWIAGQGLVVRVSPEDIHRTARKLICNVPGDPELRHDARLIASVVAYSPPSDSVASARLWAHPEWAARALPPQWIDVDSIGGPLEFVVPSFGDSFKAVVVVISLADGPRQIYTAEGLNSMYVEALHYRVDLAVRRAPFQQPNPLTLAASAASIEDYPTWSPTGTEVAYAVVAGSVKTIWRKRVSGGTATSLGAGYLPDWSPRGNLIAFVRDLAPGESRVWLHDTLTAQANQLTVKTGAAVSPAFSPNGQHIVYARSAQDFPPDPAISAECVTCGWEVRRVDVGGANDTLLARLYGEFEVRSVRWSPDGRWIYLKKRTTTATGLPGADRLWVVASNGTQAFARSGLLDDAITFDLHRGAGPLALEQIGAVLWPTTCANVNPYEVVTTWNQMPFTRLALRDTVASDTSARFYRTGAEFYNPRWSPEGTRIAYSSNQNTSSDRDLFVGQVSFNHAPAILDPTADLIVHTGRPYELYVSATDPDGEALTYQSPSAFLPSGASFTLATRRFSWPSPGPVCSENFVVFRALDGSGGVASRVVKITAAIDSVDDLNADIVGSTEVWLTWTAPGDNGSLGRGVEYELRYAQIPLHEGIFELGSPVAGMAAPGVPGSPEWQVIGGLSAGTTYYVAIRTKDAKGNWSILSNLLQVTTMSAGGGGGYSAQEIGAPLNGLRAAQTAISRPGGTDGSVAVLAVEMGFDAGAPVWSIRQLHSDEIVALGAGDSTSVLLQARDEQGAWFTRARIAPKDAAWRFGVRGLRRPGRIVFIGSYGVRQAWNSVELDGRSGAARLISAQHSRLGDVKGGFDATGTARLEVNTADTLSLRYELLAQDSETAQDWFLLVGPPGSEVSTPVRARPGVSEGKPLPTAFTLRQNQPNPFSGKTAIHFDLPVQTRVRLDIFDAQGRLIRTLADGAYPAGFHAVEWEHRTDGGQALGAGVYLYRIQAGAFRDQKKMVLLAR